MTTTHCLCILFLLQTPQLEGDAKLVADVVRGLQTQPAGPTTLESLNLPDEFLARVADRIVRLDYQRQFRAVRLATPQVAAAPDIVKPTAPVQPGEDSGTFTWMMVALGVILIAILVIPRLRRSPAP